MARGVNKIFLLGNLGDDPDVRYTKDNKPVTRVSLATTESWKDKNSGERKERTEWHKVVFFSPLAEEVGDELRKGRQVYIEGTLRTNKWQDQDGNDRYTTEVIAKNWCPSGVMGVDRPTDDFATDPAAEMAGSSNKKDSEDIPF